MTPQISGLRICSRTSSLKKGENRNGGEQGVAASCMQDSSNSGRGRAHYLAVTSKEANINISEARENPTSNSEEIYRTLEHAAVCLERDCVDDNCYTLKQFFMHLTTCDKNSNSGCMICFAFDAMVCQVNSIHFHKHLHYTNSFLQILSSIIGT